MACKNCTDCVPTKCLPACVSNVIIGIFGIDTDYFIYIEDVTTGLLTRFDATSNGSGVLTWVLGDFQPMPDHSYMLWITEINQNIDKEVEITIPFGYYTTDSTADCLELSFVYVDNTSLNKILYDTMEIEVEQ
jgi:hypothetical protein